jgi:hypothetical protein
MKPDRKNTTPRDPHEAESRLGAIVTYFGEFTRSFTDAHRDVHDVTQKLGHSRRVAGLCRDLARDLGWPEEDAVAAEAMGWLHDLGRFIQYSQHGTFNDAASVDHGALGADLIVRDGPLDGWDTHHIDAIVFAVRHHNRRCLPDHAGDRSMAFLKLLRDADKIDIMSTFGEAIRSGDTSRYPQVFADRDAVAPASTDLLSELARGETGSYDHISSVGDIILIGVSWVHDINYLPALARIRRRGLLDGFEGILSCSPEALEAVRRVRRDMDRRLAAGARHANKTTQTEDHPA